MYIGMAILSAGADIRTGCRCMCHFHQRVRLTPCGRKFYFSPVGDPRISKILDFDDFGPASPPKFPLGSKFWPNTIISHTHVPYYNPRCHSSYSPTPFFSWCSNPSWARHQIHLYFAQTHRLCKTRLKPDASRRGCDFSSTDMITYGFRWVP
jgi:hypothetical protein